VIARIHLPVTDRWGHYLDNIFPDGDYSNHLTAMIERLWRSLKPEAVYLHEITDGIQAKPIIDRWILFYNSERPHTALDKRAPDRTYFAKAETPKAA
jgi:putative transposase